MSKEPHGGLWWNYQTVFELTLWHSHCLQHQWLMCWERSCTFQAQLEHLTVLFWSSPWTVSPEYWMTQTSVWPLGADWFLSNEVLIEAQALRPQMPAAGCNDTFFPNYMWTCTYVQYTLQSDNWCSTWGNRLGYKNSSTVEEEQKFAKLLLSDWNITNVSRLIHSHNS